MPPSGLRADTWRIRVKLDGNSLGVWDKKDGGEVDSDDNKYYPGGLQPPISLGGRKTTGNVTLSRIYDATFFDAPMGSLPLSRISNMLKRNGAGKIDVSQIPLDVNGEEFGKAFHYTGTLKRVTPPTVDNESSAASMIEIEVSIAGYPSSG